MREVRAAARLLLERTGHARSELSVALVGDREMELLHRRYLGKEGPTDVLSFPGPGGIAPGEAPLLGDVVISLDTAAREAAELGVPLAERVRALLVHGYLHLLGYDHEKSPSEARRMKAREEELLSFLRRRTAKKSRKD